MKKSILSIVGIFALAAVANAQVIYDGFSYTTGTNNLNGQNGGSGFSGAWSDASATDNLSITAGSITPAATMRTGYATSGNSLISPTGAGSNIDFTATRAMTTAINLDSTSTTFFSFLARGHWTTPANMRGFNVGFTEVATGLSTNAVTASKTYGGYSLRAGVGTGQIATSTINNAVTLDSSTFIVGKLVTSNSGNETLSLNSYAVVGVAGGNVVNTTETWNISNVDLGALTGSLGYFIFRGQVNEAGNTYQVDEFRTGSSWDSVTAVPEPATWALLAGSLTTLMVLRRRRNRA